MPLPIRLLIAALAVSATAGGLRWAAFGGDAVADAAPPVTGAPFLAPSSPTAASVQPAAPRAVARAVARTASGALPLPGSLARRVDRLSRSADPVDAFAAYRLVTDCLWARDHAAWLDLHIDPVDRDALPTPQAACGDIASDQVQSRLQWLERAALAGVHHAAAALAREGPAGAGRVDEADLAAPQYADWRQRLDAAWDAGVRSCDPDALEQRTTAYEDGLGVPRDPARALAYRVAALACRQRFGADMDDGAPRDAPAAPPGGLETLDAAARGGLDPDEIAAAVAAGRRIAREARPLPGDG